MSENAMANDTFVPPTAGQKWAYNFAAGAGAIMTLLLTRWLEIPNWVSWFSAIAVFIVVLLALYGRHMVADGAVPGTAVKVALDDLTERSGGSVEHEPRTSTQLEQQRKRSIAIALSLAVLVLMFYGATWVQFTNLVSK